MLETWKSLPDLPGKKNDGGANGSNEEEIEKMREAIDRDVVNDRNGQ